MGTDGNGLYNEGCHRRLKYFRLLVLRNGETHLAFGTEDSRLRNFMLIQDLGDYMERAYRIDRLTSENDFDYDPKDSATDVVEIIKLK